MTEVSEAWATVVAEGNAQEVAGAPYVPLIELESGMSFGLTEGLTWARRDGEQLLLFSEQTVVSFIEALEHPRRDFEAKIEENAQALGMPGAETAWSFPAPTLIRKLLVGETLHFVHLALRWILPTELREMRADIHAVTLREDITKTIRDLAVHMRVPEPR